MIKRCGCKVENKDGLPVETLCKKHLAEVIAEANKAYEKRGLPKLA